MKGKLIVISGFSGSGKGTIVNYLIEKGKNFSLSISATTRKMRDGEVEGVHYFFKERNEFLKMIADGELLEHAEYAGNFYGTPRKYVIDKIENGCNVILEIEQQGAFQVKKMYPETIMIFITTDSFKTLEERIRNRNTETEETINNRFVMALREAENAMKYDYVLVNDTIENVSKKIIDICSNENHNAAYDSESKENILKINNIKEDIGRYLNV